jgi:hypothetical protein
MPELTKMEAIQEAISQNERKLNLVREGVTYQIVGVSGERGVYAIRDPYGHPLRVRLELYDEEINRLYESV